MEVKMKKLVKFISADNIKVSGTSECPVITHLPVFVIPDMIAWVDAGVDEHAGLAHLYLVGIDRPVRVLHTAEEIDAILAEHKP